MSEKALLQGRIALVTGGGTGIGAAVAKGLAAHGASVVVAGPSMESLQSTAGEIKSAGGQAWAYLLDVSDSASCQALAKKIAEDVGSVAILVNNAGVIRYAAMDSAEVQQAWSDVMEVNLSGPFNMAHAFLDQLKSTRGAIVNVSSIAAFIYTNNTVAYSASKGGIRSLTVALAKELGEHGIRVNAIAPGAINTTMSPSAQDEVKRANLVRRVPLGRIGEPEDLIGPISFLASDMAAYVTGQTLVVDGGYLTN
jgi:NAD(P)-dependent dehydrogenase (short-subunit alcohol dehydrogenase family)